MNTENMQRQTPETNAKFEDFFGCEFDDYTPNQKAAKRFAMKIERERDEAIEVSYKQAEMLGIQAKRNAELQQELATMREAIGVAQAAMEEMLAAFDSDTARRYFTATHAEGWSMLEIGACQSGRAALVKLQPFLKP